jgi:PAS domain S-box-containing protein
MDARVEPIASVRADTDDDARPDRVGDTVAVVGRVTAGRGRLAMPEAEMAVLQDVTGGLHLLLPDGPPVERGDSLRVRGVLGQETGLAELRVLTYTVVEADRRVPAPIPLTVASAAGERYEGRLVRVRGTVTARSDNQGGSYFVLEDQGEETDAQVTVFVAERHARRIPLGWVESGDAVSVTGIAGQFELSYQVEPRGADDLAAIGTGATYLWWGLYALGSIVAVAGIAIVLLRTAVRRRTRALNESRRTLRRREQRLRGLANSIPGVTYQSYVTPDGTWGYHFVGAHAEEVLGLSADPDTFREAFLKRIPEPYRQQYLDETKAAAETGQASRFEMPFERPDGTRIWLLCAAATPEPQSTREGADEIIFNGVLFDITTRKAYQQEVQRTTDLLRRAEDMAQVGGWTTMVEGTTLADTTWTDKLYDIFDLPLDAAPPSDDVLSYYHPDDRDRHRRAMTRAVEEGEGWNQELRLRTAEGRERWVRNIGEPVLEEGEVVEIRGAIQDITERKQWERELRQSDTMFENAQDALFLIDVVHEDDRRFVVQRVNPAYVRATGLAREEVQGKTPVEAMEPESGRRIESRYQKCVRRQAPIEYEEVIVLNGTTTYWETRLAPVVIDGTVEKLVGSTRDVTQQKKREKDLRLAREEAERANRAKSVFLANMSHEIRTPLTSIIGFAEVIGEHVEGQRDNAIPRFARLIEQSGTRLLDTLDGLLNLSKLDAGEMELEAEPVDLTAEAQSIVEELHPKAEAAGVDLAVVGEGESPRAHADPAGMQIVLRNLVSNAIKYTEAEGRVRLRTWREEEAAAVAVADTGIGMTSAEVEAVFEPFRQGSEGRTREFEGTGLGLAVVQQAMEQMNGTVTVETEKGEGSRFIVRLPLAPEASAA